MLCLCLSIFFFFFKQKTAYEMRISDWSSDVCSSDLQQALGTVGGGDRLQERRRGGIAHVVDRDEVAALGADERIGRAADHVEGEPLGQIGRASCRERVCQYV